MVDLDGKRQKNTEALAMFRASRARAVGGAAPIGDKAWAHTGTIFIKMPRQMLHDSIQADQLALTAAIDEHRAAIKHSLSQLHQLRSLTATTSGITSGRSTATSSSFSSESYGDDGMDSASVALLLRDQHFQQQMDDEEKAETVRRATEAAEVVSAAKEENDRKRDAAARAKQRDALAATIGTAAPAAVTTSTVSSTPASNSRSNTSTTPTRATKK